MTVCLTKRWHMKLDGCTNLFCFPRTLDSETSRHGSTDDNFKMAILCATAFHAGRREVRPEALLSVPSTKTFTQHSIFNHFDETVAHKSNRTRFWPIRASYGPVIELNVCNFATPWQSLSILDVDTQDGWYEPRDGIYERRPCKLIRWRWHDC